MSNKEQLIKNLRDLITGHGSEEVTEDITKGDVRTSKNRSPKGGERPNRGRNFANKVRGNRGVDADNAPSQRKGAHGMTLANRHQRKRMAEDQELEEMKARRSVYRYSDGSTVVNRSRKSGENDAWEDNSPMGRRDHKKSKERSGKKSGSIDDIYKEKGVHGQDAEWPRVRPSRHARKRMAEGYYWSNVDLGYAISEALGHKVKGAIQKAKEVYTKGTKKQQERGIAQANKEAEKNAAARRNK